MYHYLTGDHLPHERSKVKDNAVQMVRMALACQDLDIIHDLRELNGRPNNTLFDIFWGEIKILLESHPRVDDRRHGAWIDNASQFACP